MPFPFLVAFGYWSIPAVPIILYVFASIELVSEEVEEPFDLDENDLPLDNLVEKIQLSVETVGEAALAARA
jgi:putative membrane protein